MDHVPPAAEPEFRSNDFGRDRYPAWLTWPLLAGGVIAVLTAGILLNFGFLADGGTQAQQDLRWAAQLTGISCLSLGLLSIVFPVAGASGSNRSSKS